MDLSEQSERMQSFFNLKHDPFGVLVDSMVFSGAGGRYETAETIRHLLAYSQQDSLVVGPTGSGKRMLAQQVLKLIENHWRVTWIDGSELQSADSVLREINGQFGLGLMPDMESSELLTQILVKTGQESQDSESFLIVVQFADRLSAEVESILLNIRESALDSDTRVRQIWLAESESGFAVPLNDEDWYIHCLSDLSNHDAEQYLKDRLIAAGNAGEQPISDSDVHRLNQLATGNPAQLNELARDYLISGTFKTTERKQSFPITHVIAGLAALCLVVIAFLYQRNESTSSIVVESLDVDQENMSEVEKKLANAVAKVEAKQLNTGSNNNDDSQVGSTDVAESDQQINPTGSESVASISETAVTLNAQDSAEQNSVNQEAAVTEEADTDLKSSTPPLARLIDSASDNAFTLQLIGVRDKQKLMDLAESFEDSDRFDIVKTTHQDAPWYVLIFGEFDSKLSAENSISSLPEAFKGQAPWIRTFKSIRSDI